MSFEATSGRLRHWRTRLPKEADLRDTRTYELVDILYFSQKPAFPVDTRTTPLRFNAEETYTCALNTSSGERNEGCSIGGEALPYAEPYDEPGGTFSFAASPSGYMIRSYPLLRELPGGLTVNAFPERVILECRTVGNTTASLGFSSCEYANSVVQETYTLIGAAENQVLVASNSFQDAIVRTDWLKANQATPNRIAASRGWDVGEFLIQPLEVEFATGPWAGTTDVWMRSLDDGRGILDTSDFTSQVSQMFLYKARANRRVIPGAL